MSIFKKKKPEDKLSFRIKMAKRISQNHIRYISERLDDTDIVVGHNGEFSIKDGNLIIFAEGDVIFRAEIASIQFSELMSLEGVILTAPDLEHKGKMRTIIAYYAYYR